MLLYSTLLDHEHHYVLLRLVAKVNSCVLTVLISVYHSSSLAREHCTLTLSASTKHCSCHVKQYEQCLLQNTHNSQREVKHYCSCWTDGAHYIESCIMRKREALILLRYQMCMTTYAMIACTTSG
jgi:hypothetical protein